MDRPLFKAVGILLATSAFANSAIADSVGKISSVSGTHVRCEGYTNGGGQRVRGDLTIYKFTDLIRGQGYYVSYVVLIEASNWKRNFGWNTKRTGQLAIEGLLANVPCYSFPDDPVLCLEQVEVHADTGGDLKSRISFAWNSPLFGPVADQNHYDFELEPHLSFFGRDNTYCELVP